MDWSIFMSMGVPSAITGLGVWFLKRHIDKNAKKQEEREQDREDLQYHLIESVDACFALGEATAKAVQTGKTNGEMTKALEYAQQVKHRRKDFTNRQAVKHIV